MEAEFQVLSPLVPIRQVQFIRFCKQHSDSVWAIVDVSINLSNATNTPMFANCRRLPSGCVIQDMDNKYSKVIASIHEGEKNQQIRLPSLFTCALLIRYGRNFTLSGYLLSKLHLVIS